MGATFLAEIFEHTVNRVLVANTLLETGIIVRQLGECCSGSIYGFLLESITSGSRRHSRREMGIAARMMPVAGS